MTEKGDETGLNQLTDQPATADDASADEPAEVFTLTGADLATLLIAFVYYADAERAEAAAESPRQSTLFAAGNAFQTVYPRLKEGLAGGQSLGTIIEELFKQRPGSADEDAGWRPLPDEQT